VNPTLARVNVTAFGSQIHNLVVKDQDAEILESRLLDGMILVNVLGARTVVIDYTTPGLTLKDGPLWGLEAEFPIETNILLPTSATIISMKPVPTSIGVIGEVTTLTMPSGNISIGYIIGVVGTKEHALVVMNDAEEALSELVTQGIKVDSASSFLEDAWSAYQLGNYVTAEELARQAKNDVIAIVDSASQASSSILLADSAVQAAVEAGRMSLLDEARTKLDQARSHYDLGDYESAAALSLEAIADAEDSKRPLNLGNLLWVIPFGGVVIFLFVYLNGRRKVVVREVISDVDLESVFDAYPRLRMDDREALRFIASSGEGVFIAELRERFDLPRSSAWRMVRRLEDMGVIGTEKVGRETFLKLKDLEKNRI
jgi:uncharacterized membrane protein